MRFLPLFSLLLVVGCTPPTTGGPGRPALPDTTEVGPFESEADYRTQRAETEAALDSAVGDAAATSVDACRVVATSEQACGGPASFAVYSAESADANTIERLAARLVALDEQANAQFELVSTCMAYAPPLPDLVSGRCVAEDQ